jgi:hypothetical protein
MNSKWFNLKQQAIEMRTRGNSVRMIEGSLKIPRSTLSGWFKTITLSKKYQIKLRENWLNSLKNARSQAILWHNNQKEMRLREAENQALSILSTIDANDNSILDLALAMLYLGEGFKTRTGTGMGSSDPLILKFFIKVLISKYNIEVGKIKCALHLRADQDPIKLKRYWSKELGLPLANFNSPSIDMRTTGSPTYSTYYGVCVVQCGNIAIQRKLLFLSREFCKRAVSSVGRASL